MIECAWARRKRPAPRKRKRKETEEGEQDDHPNTDTVNVKSPAPVPEPVPEPVSVPEYGSELASEHEAGQGAEQETDRTRGVARYTCTPPPERITKIQSLEALMANRTELISLINQYFRSVHCKSITLSRMKRTQRMGTDGQISASSRTSTNQASSNS